MADLLLGDRIDLNSLEIVDNQIVIDYVKAGPNDSRCCPTMQLVETYQVVEAMLQPTHLTRAMLENAIYPTDVGEIPLEYGFYFETIAPDSTSNTTWSLNESAYGDLDGDSSGDAAAILIQNTAGSGTFYYLYAFRYAEGNPEYVSHVFLGDRINLNSLEIVDNAIVIDYVNRGSDTATLKTYRFNSGTLESKDNS